MNSFHCILLVLSLHMIRHLPFMRFLETFVVSENLINIRLKFLVLPREITHLATVSLNLRCGLSLGFICPLLGFLLESLELQRSAFLVFVDALLELLDLGLDFIFLAAGCLL